MSGRAKARLDRVQGLLLADDIDIKALRAVCHSGVPDKAGMRASCWRLLLNYLPLSRARWPSFLEQQRDLYASFVKDLITDTHKQGGGVGSGGDAGSVTSSGSGSGSSNAGDADNSASATLTTEIDDPLGALALGGTHKETKWDQYFKDNQTLEQIDKDVRRLCPEFAFYQMTTGRDRPTPTPLRMRVNTATLASETLDMSRAGKLSRQGSSSAVGGGVTELEPTGMDEAHWEVIGRILFIYAKLNPGIGYVQGMNEILGPIYYVLATDPDVAFREHAEADAFFCFTALMSEMRDVFIKTLDDSSTGIGALMQRLVDTLRDVDPSLHSVMEEMQLRPQFYAFRWMTLLLSQEFQLPDVMRLWDSLFAAQDRSDYMLFLCVGMLQNVREVLLDGDFATSLKMLQSYPECDVARLIALADKLVERAEHMRKHEEYLRTGKLR